MKLTKEQMKELLDLQYNGYCNMLDSKCMQRHLSFKLTDELHSDYISNYSERKKEYEL